MQETKKELGVEPVTPVILTVEMRDMNIHLMSDRIKIRIGRVCKNNWPIVDESAIQEVGHIVKFSDWK